MTTFSYEKGLISLTSRKYVHRGIKVILNTLLPLERTMQGALNFNGCNKLEKNSFNNVLAIKISFVFEFNSTNKYKVARQLATWQFKEGLKETEKENIWMAVEKI